MEKTEAEALCIDPRQRLILLPLCHSFPAFLWCVLIPDGVKVSFAFLYIAVLKAATFRARVTAGTPRLWPRLFRSTMIPSTPCTSPELEHVSQSTRGFPFFSVSLSLICQSLSLLLPYLSPCSLSLSLHNSLYIFWICTKAALGQENLLCLHVQQFLFHGTVSNQRSQLSCLSNQQSSTANPEGVPSAQKKKEKKTRKNKNKPYTYILQVEPLFLVCFCFFYLNVCTLVFVRYTEQGSGLAQPVPAQLFSSPS